MSLEQTHYDVAILSTGLPQSIISAALSHAGLSVIHLDNNDYYADQWASLTLSELSRWTENRRNDYPDQQVSLTFPMSEGDEPPADLVKLDRHYAFSLAPTLLPSVGPSIDCLISSKVSSYATFRLLEHISVYTNGQLYRVPSSKEDIFKAKEISLIDKRKLMKFLLQMASEEAASGQLPPAQADQPFVEYLEQVHKLSPALVDSVAYGVALCSSENESASVALERARTHVKRIGRYGNSAYLVGQYGGAGELAQGYCRASAVKGSTFILDHKITQLKRDDEAKAKWQIQVQGVEQTITADTVIASDEVLETLLLSTKTETKTNAAKVSETDTRTVRGIVVLDRPIDLAAHFQQRSIQKTQGNQDVETVSQEPSPPPTSENGLIVFPPRSINDTNQATVQVLMMGEGTFSCPKGQYVYYLETTSSDSAETTLRPVINQLLHLTGNANQLPLIELIYRERRAPPPPSLVSPSSLPNFNHLYSIPFPPLPSASLVSLTDHSIHLSQQIYLSIQADRLSIHSATPKDQCLETIHSILQTRSKLSRRSRGAAEFVGRGGRGLDDDLPSSTSIDAKTEDEQVKLQGFELIGFFESGSTDQMDEDDDQDSY